MNNLILINVVDDFFDIKRWLSENEKVVYDTGSNDLSVNNNKGNRGFVTERRIIFLGHGEKKIELYHNSVTSINYERIRYLVLIIIGIVLIGIGILISWIIGFSPCCIPERTVLHAGWVCFFAGISFIILYFRTRHFRLDIYANDKKTRIIGPKDTMQKISEEISSKRGKPSEEKQRICNVCGTNIPGGKTVCPSCGDTYH